MLVRSGLVPHAQLLGRATPALARAGSRRRQFSNGPVVDHTRSAIELNPFGRDCEPGQSYMNTFSTRRVPPEHDARNRRYRPARVTALKELA